MLRVSARFSLGATLVATALICLLHVLPHPMLLATTGMQYPYRPTNFLSELVRTQYGPLMTGCFFLLGAGAGTLALALWAKNRREGLLMALAALALCLLGLFPTDLADLTTDKVTCGEPTRIEPCTLVGRIHNPLSTLVFAPIALLAVSLLWRSRTEPTWRFLRWVILGCGALALVLLLCARLYLLSSGWTGRGWTGLMQRSLVLPAVIFLTYLAIYISKKDLS
ncbi:MAG: DUF998 domain-containing protein [Armatimonas sp.]